MTLEDMWRIARDYENQSRKRTTPEHVRVQYENYSQLWSCTAALAGYLGARLDKLNEPLYPEGVVSDE